MMSRRETKGSELRIYVLGMVVAAIASIFIPVGTVIGIAAALFCISFCMDG